MNTRRRPWLAAILSLLLPGLGHVYIGRIGTAATVYISGIILANCSMYMLAHSNLGQASVLLPILTILLFYVAVVGHATWLARRQSIEYTLRVYNRWYVYLVIVVFSALASDHTLPFVNNLQAYKIPSEAMEDTLKVGDFLIADHHAYDSRPVEAGDVIIFIFPRDGMTKYIKRCIGLPGDTIEIRDKELTINGEPFALPEYAKFIDVSALGKAHIQPRGPGGVGGRDNYGPYVVPSDHYFVMGDNRDNSFDSRFWGPVHRDLILAKALKIHWSGELDRIGTDII